MNNSIKIAHLADIQIELRVSGTGKQRYDEYANVLTNCVSTCQMRNPDIITITGDIFEYDTTTGDEQLMFSRFLKSLLRIHSTKRIIIIPGNHDIKQKYNALLVEGSQQNVADSIESIVNAIDDSRISYYKHTGIYDDTVYPIKWAVWSQIDKFSVKEPKPSYSPWADINKSAFIDGKQVIELYHDPVRKCKQFDGKESKLFDEYSITFDDFGANLILAGDIHAPMIAQFSQGRTFTYCSSLVARNFGEGNYYHNHQISINGNQQHGMNFADFDLTTGEHKVEFVRIVNPVNRHTFYINEKFTYSNDAIDAMIANLDLTKLNYVRLICQGNVKDFIEHQDILSQKFSFAQKLEFSIDNTATTTNELQVESFDIDRAIKLDDLLSISKKYVNDVVNKTKTINSEQKQQSIDYINSLLEKQLSKLKFEDTTKTITLQSIECSNFMAFGDVKFDFGSSTLNVITGANGTGKSTIMHLINWLYTDRISSSQSLRDKKQQYAQYFNSSLEGEAVVTATGVFNVDGNQFSFTKTLTRSKSGKIELTCTLVTHNNSHYNQEALDVLKDYFDFDELQKLCFINSTTAVELKQMKPEELAQEFLQLTGLNISELLEAEFDAIQDEELSKLTKPVDTIDTLTEKINSLQINKEAKLQMITDINDTINVQNERIEQLEQTKQTKESSLHNVRTVEQLEQAKQTLHNNIDSLKTAIQYNESFIQQLKNEHVDVNVINSNIQKTESVINECKLKKMQLQNQLTEIDLEISKLKEQIANRVQILQQEHQAKVDTNNQSIQSAMSVVSNIQQEIQEFHEQRKQLVENANNEYFENINKLNKNINILQQQQNQLQTSINNNNTTKVGVRYKIDDLIKRIDVEESSKDKVCSNCGSPLSESAKARIQSNIDMMQQQLEQYNAESEQLRKSSSELINQINVLIDEINALSETRNKLSKPVVDTSEIDGKILVLNSKIANENTNIAKLRKNIVKLNDEFKSTILQDDIVANLKARIEQFDKSVVNTEIAQIVEQLKTTQVELSNLQLQLQEYSKTSTRINELELAINNAKNSISNINTQLVDLDVELLKAMENVEIKKKIEDIIKLKDELTSQVYNTKIQLQQVTYEVNTIDSNIDTLKIDIDNAKTWQLVTASLKLYKRIIGKNGLSQYVFAHILPSINSHLAQVVKDVDFRLYFDTETLELRFLDLKTNVSRGLQFISGMEQTVAALTIASIRRQLNYSKRYNFVFIDEISGTLNDGKNVTYDAKNYKSIVSKYIQRLSESIQVFIIDHVLDFNGAKIYEIQPSKEGAKIVQL